MSWSQFLKMAIDQWEVSFPLFAALVAGIWAVIHFLYKFQLNNAQSTIANQQSVIKARDATIEGLKTENSKLSNEVVKSKVDAGPLKLFPVTHGNTAIRNLFAEVTSYPIVNLPTHPTDSSKWKHFIFQHPEEFERIAAARRLIESGLANVSEPTAGTYTLSASSTAQDLRSFFDQYLKDEKNSK